MAILRKTKTFEALKKKVQEQSQGSSFVNKDEIKWEPGNTYRFRLLFREEDEDSKFNWHDDLNTTDGFIKRKFHAAKDSNDKYVRVTCPVTFYGNKGYNMCPTCSDLPEMYKDGNPLYGKVKRRDGIYAYVYVVKDPVNPDNEGHVKAMWMGKKMYADLKLKIWGVDERYKPKGEELEEVDTSDAYGEEAFLLADGFDLVVKITTNKTVDPKTKKTREFNEYNCSFAKDRSSLDVDFEILEEEMEALKLGADFVPETPEKLEDFYNRCVLGNTKSEAPAEEAPAEDAENLDDIIDEIDEVVEEKVEEKVEKPKKTSAKKKTASKKKTTAKKTTAEVIQEDPEDQLEGLEDTGTKSTDDGDDDGIEDVDLDDIDIDEIMSEMDLDD